MSDYLKSFDAFPPRINTPIYQYTHTIITTGTNTNTNTITNTNTQKGLPLP
jgi:hypothetical protein